MKKIKKIIAASISLCLMFMMCLASVEAAASYEVVFRAGSHGTFNTAGAETDGLVSAEGNKVVYELGLNDPGSKVGARAASLDIAVDEGYIFSGWEIDLNTPVTEKTTYVAKYRRIANGIEYTVRYMDDEGNDVSSPIVGITNAGTEIPLYAREVEGYALQSAPSARVTVTEDGQEIIFLYTSTAEDITNTVTTPGTTTTVTVPGGTTTVTVPGATATTGTTGTAGTGTTGTTGTTDTAGTTNEGTGTDEGTTTIPDEDVPLAENPQGADEGGDDTTTIQDEEVPLADKPSEDDSRISPVVYGLGGAGIVCLIGAAALIYLKKKNKLF